MQQQQQISSKNYNIIVDFAKFLRENGHKLFEKDTKLCLNTEQILVLQEYLIEANNNSSSSSSSNAATNSSNNSKETQKYNNKYSSSKEYLLLCKSPHIYLIQDFLFKVTNVKIIGDNEPHNTIKLNIFGSLTYLEIKNCQINNIVGIQNLRSQLEVLICVKSINRVQDVLHFCGADQSSPLLWPKLHTLNLSYNQLSFLDNSFRLTPSLEILDLSHNIITECSGALRNLTKLRRLDLSFNRLEVLPELNETNTMQFELLDISHNHIDKLDVRRLLLMTKLNNLNLSNNLIIDLKELYTLRNLPNLSQLKIDNNPITYNVLCDVLVDEILVLNKKDQLINTRSNNSNINQKSPNGKSIVNNNNHQEATKSKYFRNPISPQSKKQTIMSASYNEGGRSSILSEQMNKTSMKTKPTLKFKRISSIRKVDLACDDDEHNITSDSEGNERERSNTMQVPSSLVTFGSSPVTSDYDSDRLQKELEYLKKSRKMYGAQWLLSSPNLVTIPSEDLAKKPDKSMINTLKDVIERNQIIKNNDLNSAEIIDTFAVNKIINEVLNVTKICFLAISEKYLIEKDETNHEINDFYEFIHFIDGKIYKQKLEFSMDFEKDFEKINCLYQFENEIELHNFVECLFKVLLNDFNFDKCQLYLCNKCYFINGKPTMNQSNDLICDNCKVYLIKDNKIQSTRSDNDNSNAIEILKPRLASISLSKSPVGSISDTESLKVKFNLNDEPKTRSISINKKNDLHGTAAAAVISNEHESSFLSKSLTLRDVLRTFQQKQDEADEINQKELKEEEEQQQQQEKEQKKEEESIFSQSNTTTTETIEQEEQTENNESNVSNESTTASEINIENILKNNQISKQQIDIIIKESYKLDNNLKLYFLMNVLNQATSATTTNDDEKLVSTFKLKLFFLNEPESSLPNCLSVITNKNIFIYRIKDKLLFDKNSDFDKCLKHEFTININLIEIIDISSGQHYLSIHTDNERIISKLITFDVYETQAFSSVLLKIINESNDCTSLKQIRKKNQTTDSNLLSIIKQQNNHASSIDLFSFIRYNLNDEQQYTSDFRTIALFIYNDENLMFIEENLTYFQLTKQTTLKQFKFLNSYKIIDIGNIRLFKDFDTKIEINFVDETNNSKQISLQFYVNKQFILNQLIIKLKSIWEQIFFIDLPIHF